MYVDDDARVDLDIAIEGAVEMFLDEFRKYWHLDDNEPPEGVEWEEWYELLSMDRAAEKLVAASLRLYRPGSLPASEVNWPAQLAAAAEEETRAQQELLARVQSLADEERDWPELKSYLQRLFPEPENFRFRFFRSAVQNHLAQTVRPGLYGISVRWLTLVRFLVATRIPVSGSTYLAWRAAICWTWARS